MNKFTRIVLFLAAFCPIVLVAQTTTLKSLSVNRYLTHEVPTIKTLIIYGENLWPSHMTNAMSIELVKVHFKKGGTDQIISQTSGGKTQLTVSFNSADWLATAGNIEVYVTVGNTDLVSAPFRTNSLWITVDQMPRFPPVITDIKPKEFKLGLKRDDYIITILGNFFGEIKTTSVTIGGITANYARLDLDNGYMLYWIPKELINTAGKYDVVVRTAFGQSAPVPIQISDGTVKLVQVQPVSTVPARKLNTIAANPVAAKPITTNTNNAININKAIQVSPADVTLIRGARVVCRGNIATEADKTVLESAIRNIDNVTIVDNEFGVSGNNANILITITGRQLDAASLEKIKASIAAKMAELKISPANIVIEK